MDFSASLPVPVSWIIGTLIMLVLTGVGFMMRGKQRERSRRHQAAQHFGITIPNSVTTTRMREAHTIGRVEYRLPHYRLTAGNQGGGNESRIVIPAISTLTVEHWMFSSVYPTHISDLAWQLRSRGHTIPLSPEEKAKARQSEDHVLSDEQAGRCELSDFTACLPSDLAARIDPNSGVPYL